MIIRPGRTTFATWQATRGIAWLLPRRTLTSVSIDDDASIRERCPGITDHTLHLYRNLRQGDRASLAKSITLVESTLPKHRLQAHNLISLILQDALKEKKQGGATDKTFPTSFRIGLSGPPGVGKSTFIEALGTKLIEMGHRVAVLAVDPSSSKTGGSILGDKTRMPELTKALDAYVRPSPSRGTLGVTVSFHHLASLTRPDDRIGGVARNTSEAILLCEGANYDIILVETVGVGQSETVVFDLCDAFVLLVPPAGGDELQGIKKGIVELADLILVHKADGELKNAARVAQIEYTSALKLIQSNVASWQPKVVPVSSVTKEGLNKAWDTMCAFYKTTMESGDFDARRIGQRQKWLWQHVSDDIIDRLHRDAKVAKTVDDVEKQMAQGTMSSTHAAQCIVDAFLKRHDN